MSVLDSINNVLFSNPLIDKATTDDETPTPGFLYTDIASNSNQDILL